MGKRVALGAVLLLSLMSVVSARAATLPSPWTVTGAVVDENHVSLSHVAISDGSRVVYTDDAGRYQLAEPIAFVSVRVAASKLGYTTASRTVTVLDAQQPVDFILTADPSS